MVTENPNLITATDEYLSIEPSSPMKRRSRQVLVLALAAQVLSGGGYSEFTPEGAARHAVNIAEETLKKVENLTK